MAISEDIISTRLELLGVSEYRGGIERAAGALGILKHHADEASEAQLGIGLAVGAAGVGIAAKLVEMGKLAGEEAAEFKRAEGNFNSFGHSFPVEELEVFSRGLQEQTGIARGHIAALTGLVGSYGLTADQSRRLILPILNTSEALKAQGVSAEELATGIGRALRTGNVGRLARILPINELEFQGNRVGAILSALQRRGGDAALEFRNTLPGAIQAAESSFESLKVAIGGPLIGPLTAVANFAERLASGFERIPGAAAAVTAGLGITAAASVVYGIRAVGAVGQTINLARAHLEAAAAAREHAVAEGQAATALTAESTAATRAAATTAARGGVGGGIGAGIGKLGGAGGLLKAAGFVGGGLVLGEGVRSLATEGDHSGLSGIENALGRGVEGAGIGAAVGSIIPGLGTALGAIIGGALGTLEGGIEETVKGRKREAKPGEGEDAQLKHLREQNELLRQQLDELKGIRRGIEVDVVSGPGGTRGALNGASVVMAALGRAVS